MSLLASLMQRFMVALYTDIKATGEEKYTAPLVTEKLKLLASQGAPESLS